MNGLKLPLLGCHSNECLVCRLLIVIFFVFAIFFIGWLMLLGWPVAAEKDAGDTLLNEEINKAFPTWQPVAAEVTHKSVTRIGEKTFDSIHQAGLALKDGETLELGEGIYTEPLVVLASNVQVRGMGHVVIEKVAWKGKAAIIVNGDNVHLSNIECRFIEVPDENGACIRQQGKNLSVSHMYIHDSEQGLLAGKSSGKTRIIDSRFEKLGKNGKAHGIYVGGGELELLESLVIASKDGGHEIKSRASLTVIRDSILGSFSADDSRLVDIANGGVLVIENSVMQKGGHSKNREMIGYGLEGVRYTKNSVSLKNNIFIVDREGSNQLIRSQVNPLHVLVEENSYVSEKMPSDISESKNKIFSSRKSAGLPVYPLLPKHNNIRVN